MGRAVEQLNIIAARIKSQGEEEASCVLKLFKNMKSIKTVFFVVGILIILLVILNPTNKDFDNYIHAKDFRTMSSSSALQYAKGGRINYCFIFSTFEVNTLKINTWDADEKQRK